MLTHSIHLAVFRFSGWEKCSALIAALPCLASVSEENCVMVRSNGCLQNEKTTNRTPGSCFLYREPQANCQFVLNPWEKWVNGVSWSVTHTPDIHVVVSVTPNAVSHSDSNNSMVQSIGHCVCTLQIFLMYLRLQTKSIFWLKAAFYKLNDLSSLLGWENPFFLPFSLNIPESCTWLFQDTPRREAVRWKLIALCPPSSFRVPWGTRWAEAEQGTRVREFVPLPILKAPLWGPWDMPTFSHWRGTGPGVLLSTIYSS